MKNLKNTQKKSTTLSAKTLKSLALIAPIALTAYTLQGNVSLAATIKFQRKKNDDFTNQPLNPKVLQQALKAYHWAINKGEVQNKQVLTVVDFTLPSNEKRMWVVDPNTGKVLLNLHTAQGKNSGVKYATHFSNAPGSDASSLGAYVTKNVYNGKHGKSLRLAGLEKGINNNAMKRAVVIHPANYVTPSFIHAKNRAGRSWGCFAVNPKESDKLINLTKGGSVLFAYAPAENHDPNFG